MFVTFIVEGRSSLAGRRLRSLASSAFVYSPAGLSIARMLGGIPLLIFASRGYTRAWRTLSVLLILLDLADGMLARRIDDARATSVQRRCDHLADAVLHVVGPASATVLDPSIVKRERSYVLLLVAAQALSTAACLLKFGRLPRYRTQAYRWMSGITGVALAARAADGALGGAFRPAVAMLAAAHIEAFAITLKLRRFESPIAGLFSMGVRDGAG